MAGSVIYGHYPNEFFPHTLIVPINQRSMRWMCICGMNLFQEDSSEEGRKFMAVVQHKGEKYMCCAEGRSLFWLPSTGTPLWLKSREWKSLFPFVHFIRNLNQSHCGYFHFYSLPSGNVAFYNSFYTWKSDSKCVALLLSSKYCLFSFFESSFRTCLLWKLSWLFWPAELSFGIEI